MAIGRSERFTAIRPRVIQLFGNNAGTIASVEQVLTLMEMAWHDGFGEVAPPDDVLANILTCSGGTLEGLVDAAHLAVIDWRDLAVRHLPSGEFANAGPGEHLRCRRGEVVDPCRALVRLGRQVSPHDLQEDGR